MHPHLEVINWDLVRIGMAGGQRLDDGGVVAFGFQQLAEFLQHSCSMGGNSCFSCQVTLRDPNKLWEQLQGVRVLCEQTKRIQRFTG